MFCCGMRLHVDEPKSAHDGYCINEIKHRNTEHLMQDHLKEMDNERE